MWVYFVMCISKQSGVIGPNSALVMYVVVTVVTSSTGKQSQRVRKQSAGFGEAPRPYLVKHVEVPLR